MAVGIPCPITGGDLVCLTGHLEIVHTTKKKKKSVIGDGLIRWIGDCLVSTMDQINVFRYRRANDFGGVKIRVTNFRKSGGR